LTEERSSLQQQLRSHHADLQASASLPSTTKRVSQLADLQDHLRTTERRLTEIENELAALRANQIDEPEVTRLLAEFNQTWEALAPRDQSRVLELLIERIDYRGKEGQISLTFRPSGIQTLTQETSV
jgi:site-specific DNA recombinase